MSETYKIKAVKPDPKQWDSKFGPMLTYMVLFEGREVPTEINKKPESPAPQVGEEVYGDISRTEYGDKFKSAQKPFSGGQGGKPSYGKPQDQFTMFLSYAKDLVVAHVAAQTKDGAKLSLDDSVAATLQYGTLLYEGRPDAESKPDPAEVSKEELNKVFGETTEFTVEGEEDAWLPKK